MAALAFYHAFQPTRARASRSMHATAKHILPHSISLKAFVRIWLAGARRPVVGSISRLVSLVTTPSIVAWLKGLVQTVRKRRLLVLASKPQGVSPSQRY